MTVINKYQEKQVDIAQNQIYLPLYYFLFIRLTKQRNKIPLTIGKPNKIQFL